MSEPSTPRSRPKARKGAPAATAPETPSAASPAAPKPPAAGPIDADNLDEAFIKALEADFIQYGAGAIVEMRTNKPTDYMKIVAALRGEELDDATDPLRKLSDAELDRRIEELATSAGYDIRRVASPPTEPSEE